MPKIRTQNLPHHIREKLRHQKLQQLLEEVASQVPKPSNERKETKAAKLRRVILYMKFLSKKKAECRRNSQSKLGSKLLNAVTGGKSENSAEKTRKKVLSFSENDYRKAQIIFLRKSSKSSDKKGVEYCTDVKENNVQLFNCCENNVQEENQMNYAVIRKNSKPSVTDNMINQRCDISEPEKLASSGNQIKNIFYNDPPFSMETKEESLKATNTCNDHFEEILLTRKPNLCSSIQNLHATKFASNCEAMNTNWDYQHSMSNNSANNDFNSQFQMYPKYEKDYSESYKNNFDSDELTFHNNSPYYPSFSMEARKTLPPMSVFSPYSPEPLNIVSNKEGEFYKFESSQVSNSFSKPDMHIQMSSELSQNELSSVNCATFPSDENFSENLQSSGESAFITSSNEWLSDDTVNELGNFAKSSCFDSPTNDTMMSIKSLPFQNGIVHCVQSFDSDASPFGSEQFCELKSYINSNSRHSSPLYKPETNERNAFFTSQLGNDRYHKTNAFQPWDCYDKNVLLPMHFSQGAAWQPYAQYSNSGRKGKSCTIVNSEMEDSCVPEYAYDINTTNELEEEDIIDVSRFEEVNSCGNIPNFPLKSECDDSPLSLKENSYSFKNFSQWFTKNCFD